MEKKKPYRLISYMMWYGVKSTDNGTFLQPSVQIHSNNY